MTPTTAQIMTENTVSQTYRATYSPDDNKLRLYASLRLDEETYSLINKAGFRWAPKQELFVAPARTPGGRMSCFPSPVISRTRTAPCLIAGSSAPGGSVTTVTGGRLNRSRRLRMLIRWHRLSRWDSRSGKPPQRAPRTPACAEN